jgi:hypothetical protein
MEYDPDDFDWLGSVPATIFEDALSVGTGSRVLSLRECYPLRMCIVEHPEMRLVPRWAVALTLEVHSRGVSASRSSDSIRVAIEEGLDWCKHADNRVELIERAKAYAAAWALGQFEATRALTRSTSGVDSTAKWARWAERLEGAPMSTEATLQSEGRAQRRGWR